MAVSKHFIDQLFKLMEQGDSVGALSLKTRKIILNHVYDVEVTTGACVCHGINVSVFTPEGKEIILIPQYYLEAVGKPALESLKLGCLPCRVGPSNCPNIVSIFDWKMRRGYCQPHFYTEICGVEA